MDSRFHGNDDYVDSRDFLAEGAHQADLMVRYKCR